MTSPLQIFAASHRGHVRARNEDAWLFDAEAGLAVVADGMGGHPAGADASALAVRAFVDALRSDAGSIWDAEEGGAMARGVAAAHAGIREVVSVDASREGMGTTLTAAVFGPGGRMAVAHVGDSRLYRLRSGRLELLTRDHTWVAEAVEAGHLRAASAPRHPMAHVLTQAVGIEMPPQPDVEILDTRAGDVFLLCSDGLTGPVSDDEIARILTTAGNEGEIQRAPGVLVEAALAGGGPDNVTALVVRVGEPGRDPAPPS